jgi:hypothetical protein
MLGRFVCRLFQKRLVDEVANELFHVDELVEANGPAKVVDDFGRSQNEGLRVGLLCAFTEPLF